MFNRSRPEEIHNYVEERLSDYLDGTLPPKERSELDAHLKQCERCAASLGSLRWTVGLLKQAPGPSLPRSFTLPVPESQRAPAPRPAMSWNWGGLATLAATFVVVVFLTIGGVSLFLYGSSPATPAPNVALAPVVPTASAAKRPPEAVPTARDGAQLNTLPPSAATAAPSVSTFAFATPAPTEPPTQILAQEASPAAAAGIQMTPTPVAPAVPPQPAPTQVAKSAGASATPQGLSGGAGGPADSSGSPGPTPATRSVTSPGQGTIVPTGIGVPAQVVSTTLAARAGPDIRYQEVTRLRLGDVVTVVGLNPLGDWFAIRYPENTVFIAWVPTAGVKLSEQRPLPTIIAPTRTPTP